jgi:lycopene beta-cyclase
MKHYDYIFTGAGLSALMTVYKMVQSDFTDKSILLLDENTKKTTELGVSGKQRFTLGIYFKKMDSALFANETFAGFRLATVSLQYGESDFYYNLRAF